MFNRLCAAVISLRPRVPEQHYHDLSLTPRRDGNSHRSPEGNNRRAERGREKEERSGESERGDTPTWKERLTSFSSCPFHYSECSMKERTRASSHGQKVREEQNVTQTHPFSSSVLSSELKLPFITEPKLNNNNLQKPGPAGAKIERIKAHKSPHIQCQTFHVQFK